MLQLTIEEFQELCKLDAGICLACLELTIDIITTEVHSDCPQCLAKQLMTIENALMYQKIIVK